MKYIFLDIDGVLNTKKDWKKSYSLNDHCIKNFALYTKELCSNDLSSIKIILISSWREGFSKDGNHLPQIKLLNEKLKLYELEIFDKTYKSPMNDRQREIEQYLLKNHINKKDCIIIDDDMSLYKNLEDYEYINPDPEIGFVYQNKKWHLWRKK